MAALTQEQKLFVTMHLATFHGLTEVKDLLFERYGVESTIQQLSRYDPGTAAGQTLSAVLKKAFEKTREQFIESQADIAISHRSWRLREIQRLYEANRKGSRKLSADLLLQAAREAGGMYERRDEPAGLEDEIANLLEKLVGHGEKEAQEGG